MKASGKIVYQMGEDLRFILMDLIWREILYKDRFRITKDC